MGAPYGACAAVVNGHSSRLTRKRLALNALAGPPRGPARDCQPTEVGWPNRPWLTQPRRRRSSSWRSAKRTAGSLPSIKSACRSSSAKCSPWWEPRAVGRPTFVEDSRRFANQTAGQITMTASKGLACRRMIGRSYDVSMSYALFPHNDVSGNVAYGLQRRDLDSAAGRKSA